MADYCTPEQVRAILRGVDGDDDGGLTAAELADSQIQLEIDNAKNRIDAVLSARYHTPFNPVPGIISDLCRDHAAYFSDLNYRKSREYESDNYPIIRRYNNARELLEWLRTGVATLPDREPNDVQVCEVVHQYEGNLMTYEEVFGPFHREW